jgi:hypothetical protein
MNIDESEIAEIGQLVTILKMLCGVRTYLEKNTNFDDKGIGREIYEFEQQLKRFPSHALVAYMMKTFDK